MGHVTRCEGCRYEAYVMQGGKKYYVKCPRSRCIRPPMTDFLRIQMYNAGCYEFPAPDVCTSMWTVWSWIKWIDAKGVWKKREFFDMKGHEGWY